MAGKKKTGKKLGKKDLKKTKGGILIGLNQPTLSAPQWKIDVGNIGTTSTIFDPNVKL